jgi:hypothetical protein
MNKCRWSVMMCFVSLFEISVYREITGTVLLYVAMVFDDVSNENDKLFVCGDGGDLETCCRLSQR